MMIALIMAGGSGTRFWPLSRRSKPKQFLQVLGEKSMIQLTVERLEGVVAINDVYIVTALSQVELIKEHLPQLPMENIIIEPFGMNTAPCIGLSLAYLKHRIKADESIIVLPADHIIRDKQAFQESLKVSEAPAQQGYLVTFGIVPEYPATGYGYIEAGEAFAEGIYTVKRFKEKPDFATAESFIKQGNFYWNSGMFYWKYDVIYRCFEQYLPEVTSLLEEIMFVWKHQGAQANITDIYSHMPRVPIDIGIMEQAEQRAVVPVNYGWSDVGSWKALAEITPADANGNVLPKDCLALDSKGNYIVSDKFVSLIGVDNLVVVETEDAILITVKDRSEDVKKVVDSLTASNIDKLL